MKLFSLFKSASRSALRRNRSLVRAKRASLLERSDFYEGLEKRQLLAAFSNSGGVATIDLNVTNQLMTISANATAYTFTLSGGATNVWNGTNSGGFLAVGPNLTVNSTALANVSLFNIGDSANGTGITFGNSGANSYKDSFNITLNNTSNSILFSGNTTFSNSTNLTLLVDSRVELPSASSLTMTNGNLSMDINTQATPQVLNYSGLMVNNATIRTTGNGSTTITARGGNGSSISALNKGVAVITGGQILGGTTGTMHITGYGYTGVDGGVQAQGVFVNNSGGSANSVISSIGANVSVTGYGANSTNATLSAAACMVNAGVVVGGPSVSGGTFGGCITSGGNGTVSVTGYGGTLANQSISQNGFAMGVYLNGSNATITSGGAGLVTVLGYGGGANANTACGMGVQVFCGTITSGNNGSVVVNGTGCTTACSTFNWGVWVSGSAAKIAAGSGTGTTTVVGTGGGCGTAGSNDGVCLTGSGTITSFGSGNVTVTGYGGTAGTGNTNRGINISFPSLITSNGGAVLVTGYGGGSGTSANNFGLAMTAGGTITAGGLGSVTVNGYGGNNNGTGGTNYGVNIDSGGSGQQPGKVTSSGGDVLVQGYGGGGTANSPSASASATNYGVFVNAGGYIQPGGAGTLTVYGEGGGRSPGATGINNWGVAVAGANTTGANTAGFSFISSSGGAVSVTGKGGGGSAGAGGTSTNNFGVLVSGGGLITSGGNADLTVNGTGGGYGNSTTGSNYGVYACGTANVTSNGQVVLSTIKPGGEGDLVINGTGGGSAGTGASNYGVAVGTGALITASGLTSSVTINGQGGSSSGQQNYGVSVTGVSTVGTFNSTITSGGGNVTVTGCGPLSTNGLNQHGVVLNTCGTITSGGNGSVTVTGRAGTGDVGTSSNGHIGVQVIGSASITSGGNGPVSVTGYGGGNGARVNNYGVQVSSVGTNTSVITGGANAPVTVVGYGGNANGTGGTNHGACVTGGGSKITSSNGPVSITAYGGQANTSVSSTSGSNYGLYVDLGGEVSATGSAPISVTGYGGGLGTGATQNNYGVIVVNVSPANLPPRIASDGGPITIVGTGGGTNGSGSLNHGVCITQGGQVVATGSGTNISITGTGGGGSAASTSYGVMLGGCSTVSLNTIMANGGDILVTGIEGSGSGSIGVYGCTTYSCVLGDAAKPGNITIVTNSAALATLAGSAINANQLVIVPRTPGVGVELGCTTNPKGGPLNLSSTELGTVNSGTIQLGNSSTGNFTVSSVGLTVPTGSNLTLVSNSAASTGISSSGTITMGAGKALNVSAVPSVNTLISGTTAQTQYSQLSVVGNLSIAGKPLNLSGSYTPTGGDVFTIANATSLTGTFTGLADGSTRTFNGRTLLVNYNATSATLTDPAPKVTTQPANSTVTAGTQASFTAAASGTPAPSVQWQESTNGGTSWTDITGATSPTYSFTTAAGDNTKQYHAVFTNTYGNATSDAATLTVQFAPSITTQPTDQTVNDGQTATFTAAASGNPTPSVRWQSSPDGTNWTDIGGATATSYTTGTLSSTDNGTKYRALFTNSITADVATNVATLTVNSSSSAPSISTQPTNQSANTGGTATFSAAATGSPTPTVQWQVNSGSGWANVTDGTGGTTDSYTTAALTTAQNGYQYRAVYTNGVGSDATTNAATLTVNAATSAPVITGQPVSIGVAAGQTASFTATATGNPTPTVQWQSSPDGSTGWADITGATSGTLSFTATVGDNGKYYRAVFSNGVNPDATTNAAKLSIGVAPAIITASEMTIPVGLTSGMTVIATGSPAPTYSVVGTLPSGVTIDPTTGLFSGTPAAGSAGTYAVSVEATNGIGTPASQAFTLKVTSTINSFTVSKGQAQRSYIRYLDLGMDSNASALTLLNNPNRVRLTKADLNGVGSAPVSLSGFLSVATGQSKLSIDFGTIGLGNSRNATTADGYYTLGVDLDGNGSFETNLFFFRLFGDTNGDREVTAADQSAVLAGCTQPYNANLDLNGDGVVNTSDYQYVKKNVGRKLKSTLIVTA